MVLSVPSKTFLIGEYGALIGGESLLINSSPRFRLTDSRSNVGKWIAVNDLASESPVGRLFNSLESKSPHLFFEDPHEAKGGLGASSAQFALLYAYQYQIESWSKEALLDLLKTYKKCSVLAHGRSPSGYDVVSQVLGGIARINVSENIFESIVWPFERLSYFLLRTGRKLSTHHHLEELKKQDTDYQILSSISRDCVNAYINRNEASFVDGVKRFSTELSLQGLVASETLMLLQELQSQPDVLASKGCGALGADTLLVIFKSEAKASIYEKLNGKFEVIASEKDIDRGMLCD